MNKAELLEIAKQILFNTEMVQAIMNGRKTMTRRVIKPQPMFESGYDYPHENELGIFWKKEESYKNIEEFIKDCPYGRSGDVLYVRETWQDGSFLEDSEGNPVKYIYKADDIEGENSYKSWGIRWKPSIHMPKEAARIFLKVTDVRVERVQDITEEGVAAEGVKAYGSNNCSGTSARIAFAELWDSLYKDMYEWRNNPWVWVIEFERVM